MKRQDIRRLVCVFVFLYCAAAVRAGVKEDLASLKTILRVTEMETYLIEERTNELFSDAAYMWLEEDMLDIGFLDVTISSLISAEASLHAAVVHTAIGQRAIISAESSRDAGDLGNAAALIRSAQTALNIYAKNYQVVANASNNVAQQYLLDALTDLLD